MEKVPMLAEGYERLTADLKVLRAERPKIVEAIEEARAHGDLSENAEYHAAKERQGQVEALIGDIEDRVSRAQPDRSGRGQRADLLQLAHRPRVDWQECR
jgi:transcription elongation factor GreA